MIAIAFFFPMAVSAQSNQPTVREISDAYQSKAGEGGMAVPHFRWEAWRIKEVRGWELRFKRVAEEKRVGLMTLKYRVIAKKNNVCAGYQITDTRTFPPQNLQIPSSVVVDPSGLERCH